MTATLNVRAILAGDRQAWFNYAEWACRVAHWPDETVEGILIHARAKRDGTDCPCCATAPTIAALGSSTGTETAP